jgi:hypothetical protein
MAYCPNCGAENAPTASYCSNCGQRLAPATQTATAPPPPPPPAPPAAPAPTPAPQPTPTLAASPGPAAPTVQRTALPSVNWRPLVIGNWVGAGLTAATALGVSGVLATALGLLAKPADFGWDNSLTMVAWIMTSAFGADLNIDFELFDSSVSATLGLFPLTVTIISLAAAVLVFRRLTRGYSRAVDALGDAVRAALLFGLGLMVVALVFRADSDEFGRGWGRELQGLYKTRLEFGVDAAGAFFLGFLVLLAVLVASCLARREWWPAPVRRIQDWLVAPLYGLAAVGLLLPIAGLIGLGLLLITGETIENTDPTTDDILASLALYAGLLANGGYWLISLGAGAALQSRGEEVGGSTSVESHHLPYFADDDPGLWAAPAVMVALLLVATYVVARKSPTPARILPNLGIWVAVVLVTTPLFVRVTSLHAAMDIPDEDVSGHGTIGVVGWQATLFLTLATLVCSFLVALMTRSLSVQQVRGGAASFGRMVQSNPGRPHQDVPVAPPAPPAPYGQPAPPAPHGQPAHEPPPPPAPGNGPAPRPDDTRLRPPK